MDEKELNFEEFWQEVEALAEGLQLDEGESDETDDDNYSQIDWSLSSDVAANEPSGGEEEEDDALLQEEDRVGEDYIASRVPIEIAKRLIRYSSERDLAKAAAAVKELAGHFDWYGQDAHATYGKSMEDLVGRLEEWDPVLLYQQPLIIADEEQHRLIEVPELLLAVSSDLVELLAREPDRLWDLSSRSFEVLMAEVFSRFGWAVELTAPSRDGGKDLIAVSSMDGISLRLLVECKRFSRERAVGIGLVRELFGVKQLERATKAVLATTSYFSREAREMERQLVHELELKDYRAVLQWIQKAANRLLKKPVEEPSWC